MINSISRTALVVACSNQNSGIPYCKEIAEMTGAEKATRKIFGDDYERCIIQALAGLAALRYLSMTAAIVETGIKNLLEIACGLDPRGFNLIRDSSFTVVETDLPAMVVLKQDLASQLGILRSNYHLVAADATSASEIKYAAGLLGKEPIVMACSGLLSYFPLEKKHLVMEAISREIHRRNGSIWFATTEDFITKAEINIRLPNNEVGQILMNKLSEISGQDLFANALDDPNTVDELMREHGLRASRRKRVDLVPNFVRGLGENARRKFLSGEIWTIQQT